MAQATAPVAVPEVVKGHLVVSISDASGLSKTKANSPDLWDPAFTEGFVKVEIRGGARTVKAQTKMYKVRNSAIAFQEELRLEVLEGASELRLMLCKEKRTSTRTSSSTVAACGIYVADILDAVPIDKYFELFKTKGEGGDGGYVRIAMNYVEADGDAHANGGRDTILQHSLSLRRESAAKTSLPEVLGDPSTHKRSGGGGFPWKLLLLGVVGSAAVAGAIFLQQQKDSSTNAPKTKDAKKAKA